MDLLPLSQNNSKFYFADTTEGSLLEYNFNLDEGSLSDKKNFFDFDRGAPDGSTIAFNYKGDIYLVNSKGGKAHAITTHSAHDFMPTWSPDGETIAFASNRYGNYDIFKMSSKGGNATRLTYNSSDDYPSSIDKSGNIYFSSSRLDNNLSSLHFKPKYFDLIFSLRLFENKLRS